jgi:hypothetical protein
VTGERVVAGLQANGLNFEVNFDFSHDGVMRFCARARQRLAIDAVDASIGRSELKDLRLIDKDAPVPVGA